MHDNLEYVDTKRDKSRFGTDMVNNLYLQVNQ